MHPDCQIYTYHRRNIQNSMTSPHLGQIAYVIPSVFSPPQVEQIMHKPATPVYSPLKTAPSFPSFQASAAAVNQKRHSPVLHQRDYSFDVRHNTNSKYTWHARTDTKVNSEQSSSVNVARTSTTDGQGSVRDSEGTILSSLTKEMKHQQTVHPLLVEEDLHNIVHSTNQRQQEIDNQLESTDDQEPISDLNDESVIEIAIPVKNPERDDGKGVIVIEDSDDYSTVCHEKQTVIDNINLVSSDSDGY